MPGCSPHIRDGNSRPSVRSDAEVDFLAGEKECYEDIRVFTIGGGGGPSGECCDGAGGGGSGYVNQTYLRVWSNNVDPWVVVVGGGGDSNVNGGSSRVEMGDLVLLEAKGGHAGSSSYGGDGYSGGGGGSGFSCNCISSCGVRLQHQ